MLNNLQSQSALSNINHPVNSFTISRLIILPRQTFIHFRLPKRYICSSVARNFIIGQSFVKTSYLLSIVSQTKKKQLMMSGNRHPAFSIISLKVNLCNSESVQIGRKPFPNKLHFHYSSSCII